MDPLKHFLTEALGLGLAADQMDLGHMLVRAGVICFATLLMMRLAGRRFLAHRNPFDVLLGFIIASMMSRAINGPAAFFETVATGFVIAAVYRFVALWASQAHWLGKLLKGEPQTLVENGHVQPKALKRHSISENDLEQDLRLNAALDGVQHVKAARIERNGEISVLRQPQVYNIRVENGVQTVRLLIE